MELAIAKFNALSNDGLIRQMLYIPLRNSCTFSLAEEALR